MIIPFFLGFVASTVKLPDIREQKQSIEGVVIVTYIVLYDEEKDFQW
ncbi:MAG: hypothetical protein QG657_5759 [Acidobacteriota bacterium]|nr:hypothetical protein [Acidobacteriota bacterium]